MGFLKSLFGPPDIDSLRQKGDVRGLIKAARYGDAAVQARALEALTGLGGVATSTLLEMTLSEKARERANAIELFDRLGWKPDSPDEKTLFLIAKDKWDEVGALGDAAIPAMTAGIRDEKWDFHTRTLAAAALGYRGDPTAAKALAGAYTAALLRCARFRDQMKGVVGASTPEDWLAFCVVAQIALSRLGRESAQGLVDELEKLWLFSDGVVDVAQCLAMIGQPAVEPLTEVLRASSAPRDQHQNRVLACLVLGLGSSGEPGVESLLLGLAPFNSDSREAVKLSLRIVTAASESLIGDLGDQRPEVRLAAAAALANRGERAAIPGLVHLLGDRHAPPQLMATIGLGKLGGPAATEALCLQLKAPETARKTLTIMALQQIGGPAVVEALEPVRSDPSGLVKSLAELTIANLQSFPRRA